MGVMEHWRVLSKQHLYSRSPCQQILYASPLCHGVIVLGVHVVSVLKVQENESAYERVADQKTDNEAVDS